MWVVGASEDIKQKQNERKLSVPRKWNRRKMPGEERLKESEFLRVLVM